MMEGRTPMAGGMRMFTRAMKRAHVLALAALLCAAMPLAAAAEANPTLEPVQPLRSARIRSVGDLMAPQKQLDYALQADGSYDFHPQYALVADSLRHPASTESTSPRTARARSDRPRGCRRSPTDRVQPCG